VSLHVVAWNQLMADAPEGWTFEVVEVSAGVYRVRGVDNYVLWNNAHSATLADYGLVEGPGVLYHPSVAP
jgi:hypothetical protein